MLGRSRGPSATVHALISGLLATAFAVGAAEAATTTGSIGVTTTVQATCTVSAAALTFGTYTGAVANATSALQVTCTSTTPYSVALNAGLGAAASTTLRKMTGAGGITVNYSVWQDAGHTSNWGNTVGTNVVTGTGNGAAQSISAYGQIPAGQLVTPGAYTDTLTATINY